MELSISFFLSSLRRFVFSSMIAKDFLFSLVNFRRKRIFSRVWILETLSITFSVSSAYDFFKMSTCSKISYNVACTQNCPKIMKMVRWPFVPFSMEALNDEFKYGSTDTFFYLTYYPSRVEFDCFLKHIPSPVEQTSLQGQFHWIWQFLTIVWLRLPISCVPSKTDCNYGTPIEGSISEKHWNSDSVGSSGRLEAIYGRDIGG